MVAGDIETNPWPSSKFNLWVTLMGHINARSLNIEDKFDEICCLVHNVNLDILAVSETWLNDSISSDSLNIQGFAPIIRLDRQNGRRAGGVALYISSSIAYRRRLDLENCEFELLFVEFKICNTNFVCAVCYRPPNYSAIMNSAFLTHLQNCLDRIRLILIPLLYSFGILMLISMRVLYHKAPILVLVYIVGWNVIIYIRS